MIAPFHGTQSPYNPVRTGLLGVVAALLGLVAGCATLGQRVEHTELAPGAPTAQEVRAALAENDAKLTNFRAAGSFTIESPELKATERFPSGMVAFRKPGDLHVEGRIKLNIVAFELTSRGNEFLIEFPTKRDVDERYYYRLEGEVIESVPFSVSPSDVAREMFIPEEWARIPERHMRVIAYDAAAQEATLLIGPARHPRRRIVVHGPPWVVVKNERLLESGDPLAVTLLSDYHVSDGVMFPAKIDVSFPTQQARMTFEMRNIRINTTLDDALFRIAWRPGKP
ncbi:MAG: hypothetical protein K1Y02_21495 [Candidatus Hydrogenedentes bacterium]|nr:hypothetical protein [Candidatus Hydrogenedentota bacterium]